MVKNFIKKYYSPSNEKWRKAATCTKIFLTSLAGIITNDFHQTAAYCLIGCLVCDFIVNLCSPEDKSK